MEELQNIFDVNDIKHARITGDGVPEEIMGMLGMVVEEVVGIVGRMIRIEGMNMFDLVTANVDRCDHVCDEQMRDVWVRVGKLVNLTPDQVSMMKVLRAEHLKKLEDIYNRRQKLNLEAISVLLPGGGGAGGAFGQVGNRFGGFLSRSKENDRTGKVLDSLKENLKEEQRLARELEYIVFNRLLNPIQVSIRYSCLGGSLGKS